MKRETLEQIVKSTKKDEKLIVITNIIESHGGYSASHKELELSKNDLLFKDDYIEINMPITNRRASCDYKEENYIQATSVAHHHCMKATMYVEYESIISVIVISGESKAVVKY